MRRSRVRYVLIAPCWMLLVDVAREVLIEAIVLGPTFSSQARSMVWVATVWPNRRLSLGTERCAVVGKKPSMLEKWWGVRLGWGLSCFWVRDVSSRAIRRPRAVTTRAVIFKGGAIVITGALIDVVFRVIISPAIMLPQAKCLMGRVVRRAFSFRGVKGGNRGEPMETETMIRRL